MFPLAEARGDLIDKLVVFNLLLAQELVPHPKLVAEVVYFLPRFLQRLCGAQPRSEVYGIETLLGLIASSQYLSIIKSMHL